MLWEDVKRTRNKCFKIFLCNIVIMIGYAILMSISKDHSDFVIYALLIILSAVITIFFLVMRWMKEVQVTLKKIRLPVCIMMIPAIIIYISCTYFDRKNPFLLCHSILLAFIFMTAWFHKQLGSLPAALRMTAPELEESHPEIFRTDISRISDSEFFMEMSDILDKVPEEKINEQLRNAVTDWYSVYISMAFIMEGILLAILLLAFYV